MELGGRQGLRRPSLWREIWYKWLRQELEDTQGGGIYEVPKRYQLAAQSPGASRGSQSIQHLLSLQCPTLCDPTDCSLPGSSVHEILLGWWVARPSSKGSYRPMD